MVDLRNLSQEELIRMIEEKDKKIEALTEQLDWYAQQVKLQQKKLFGSSSEKTVLPEQISLFDEIEVEASPIKVEPQLEEITYQRKKKKKHHRGIDISSLPVRQEIYDLENKECPECGSLLRKIGENKRKELIYHPARYEVVEYIQYVYTCDKCEKEAIQSSVYKASMKEPVIYKSFASPSLLAAIIDRKFSQSLPLYRQEVIFHQARLELSRQTMANWMIKLYDNYFKAIIEYMHQELLKSEYLHADETTCQVLKVPNQKASTKSYMWVYKTGRSEAKQMVLFKYENTRSHEHPKKHLKGYTKTLQSDGYQAYDKLENMTQVGCFVHARRKYKEAMDSAPANTDLKGTASYRLFNQINQLFEIERATEGKSYDEIKEIRQKEAKPIVDAYFEEVKEYVKAAVPKTKLYEALVYSVNQEDKLRAYLEDGRVEISNNRAENAIRPFCIGRKNWLFSNSVQGAETSAALYSLVETVKLNHLKIYEYLEYLLSHAMEMNLKEPTEIERYMPWSKDIPQELRMTEKS